MREVRQDTRRQKSLYQAEDVLPSINAPQRTAQVGKPSVQIGIEHWMVVGENALRQRVGQSVVPQKLLASVPPNHAREQQDQQRGPAGVDDCANFTMPPNAYVCGMPENAMSHKLSNHPAWTCRGTSTVLLRPARNRSIRWSPSINAAQKKAMCPRTWTK